MLRLWRQHREQDASTSAGLTPSAVLSIVAHAVVIVAAIDATANSHIEDRALPENSIARFLAPPDRDAGQVPRPEMIRYVAIAVPNLPLGKTLVPVDQPQAMRQLTHLDERD